MNIDEIRKKFLDFFIKNDHIVKESSPLVPHNDSTLLFVNAGMVPFKEKFLNPRKKENYVSCQKCVRAGGKHNDLENVGYTARHHTFFEMLGNFSFGGYGDNVYETKKKAILLAWEFVTKKEHLNIDINKLYVTVYEKDTEAYNLWNEVIGLSSDRIIRIGDKKDSNGNIVKYNSDNFWSMGNTGPCGPCTEIFYDYGDKVEGGLPGTKDEDGDRYVEIWNIVFTQYNKLKDGSIELLDNPCIDTGMGLERILSVKEGKTNNFETSIFEEIIKEISYESASPINNNNIVSMRVIADHMRCAVFLISDGVLPSNEGRGYVLRKIIRRAFNYAKRMISDHYEFDKRKSYHTVCLGIIDKIIVLMENQYPDIRRAESLIKEIVDNEISIYDNIHDKSLEIVCNFFEKEKITVNANSKDENLSNKLGELFFELYDTFGCPIEEAFKLFIEYEGPCAEIYFDEWDKEKMDFVNEKARENSLIMKEFYRLMEEQKQRGRSSWKGKANESNFDIPKVETEFLGYDLDECEGKILLLIKDKKCINETHEGKVDIVVDKSVFYKESGGQIGDTGKIYTKNNAVSRETLAAEVVDTQQEFDNVVLKCLVQNTLKIGDIVILKIDTDKRNRLRKNHSATHLLHHSLREVLGKHVTQKGSLVEKDRLRFDFSHAKTLTKEEILAVEKLVNSTIMENHDIIYELSNRDNAIKMGAMALFGEKYEDTVRIIRMGPSIELCGGTHAKNTGEIGLFKIIKEFGISSGVRRIEAITGHEVLEYINMKENIFDKIKISLKINNDEKIVGKINDFVAEKKYSEESLEKTKKELIEYKYLNTISLPNNINFIYGKIEDVDIKIIRDIVLKNSKKLCNSIHIICNKIDNKYTFILGISNDLSKKAKAVELLNEGIKETGYSCKGGKENFAQTGYTSVLDERDKVIKNIKEIIYSIK